MSHYIWNRADRVDPKLMPDVLVTCFMSWQKGKLNEINDFTDEERKNKIFNNIKAQKKNLNEAVRTFNNKDKNNG